MAGKTQIAFDAERMKYPDTGLYHFCLHLGHALLRQQQAFDANVSFYVRPAQRHVFGPDANIIPQHSLQKFWMPSARNYDVWHATYQATNYFPASTNAKMVLTIHDLNFLHEPKTQRKRSAYLKKLAKKIKRADEVAVISHFVKKEVEENFDIPAGKIHVIYNGSNIVSELQPVVPAIVPARPFFFSIGTVLPKKNFHVLPRMLRNQDYSLVIAGAIYDKEYAEKIKMEAKSIGVADQVILTGPVTEAEKYWYLQHCSAFAFPSLAEGFGLPVIEAMHFGKPALLSSFTSLPEIGGEAAYYFENFDAGHMTELAARAVQEFDASRAQASRNRALLFNWDRAARQYFELYLGGG